MLHPHFLAVLILATATAPVIAGNDNESKRDFQPATYCVYDLGRLPDLPVGETFVTVNAINNRNQIVGSISITGGGRTHPFIWDRKHGMRDLGVLPGLVSGNATDINDRRKVVGDIGDPETGHHLAFIWDKRNGMRALDASLGGDRHGATGINRFGQIVGSSAISTSEFSAFHAFFRDVNGDVFDLGAFPDGHGDSAAAAVNDLGQVVGVRFDALVTEAFIWDKLNGVRLLVEDAGTLVILPGDINNSGEVVGGTFAETTRAFRWTQAEGLQDLGSLSGSDIDFTTAAGINEWGTIVGTSQVVGGASHAFIWRRSSGMRDLNELIDPTSTLAPHIVLRAAQDINDFGWIAAGGVDTRDTDSPERGFLLAPRRHLGSPRCR